MLDLGFKNREGRRGDILSTMEVKGSDPVKMTRRRPIVSWEKPSDWAR
jgi:hypothetical protein